ncbi:hypothetical protein GCM10010987_50690 [Bradyrhizobium guangdongense]|uniref:Uncharacterized protein n=1 Tax=Bradyrhizobium guangdongense TaxID=1325090 RepID=A0AA88B8N6_9BRAD|nr:hypothetical protein GCM10010987_50690 [Bradyrhizobium guangdongense]
MAQAFKFPTEAYDGSPAGPALGSLAQARRPDRRFQPVRSGRSDYREYGPAPGSPQACRGRTDAAVAVPIPGPAIPTKVNQFGPI